jgi:hypothetical protein
VTRVARGLSTCLALALVAGCARDVAVGHEDMLTAVPGPGGTGGGSGAPASDLIWSAEHEVGTFDEWLEGDDGIQFVAYSGQLAITSEHAHTGDYAFSASITANDGDLHQAVMGRMVRLAEGRYAAWYLLPEAPVADFWVIMKLSNGSRVDRFDLDVQAPEGGEPRLRLYEHDTGDPGWITEPSPIAFPVGRWTHVEVLYRSTPDDDGRLVVFQDGEQVLATGERATAEDDEVTFYCGSVSRDVTPAPYRLFIDDASIRQEAFP